MTAQVPGRALSAQLSTAKGLLAMFVMQISEYEAFEAMNRRQRRRALRDGSFDVTILDRIDQLRTGHRFWSAKVAELEAAIAADDEDPAAWLDEQEGAES